jgi:hypothetical protein
MGAACDPHATGNDSGTPNHWASWKRPVPDAARTRVDCASNCRLASPEQLDGKEQVQPRPPRCMGPRRCPCRLPDPRVGVERWIGIRFVAHAHGYPPSRRMVAAQLQTQYGRTGRGPDRTLGGPGYPHRLYRSLDLLGASLIRIFHGRTRSAIRRWRTEKTGSGKRTALGNGFEVRSSHDMRCCAC